MQRTLVAIEVFFKSRSIAFLDMRVIPTTTAPIPQPLGMRGFVSDSNVPSLWPERRFFV